MQRWFQSIALVALAAATACSAEENDVPPGYPGSADCLPTADPPLVEPSRFPACGPNAHCVPAEIIAIYDASQVWRLAPCPELETSRCVPDAIIKHGLRFVPPTCVAFGALEGRCLPTILPEVQKQRSILEPSTCASDELCSPCYHPITGRDTGACNITTCDPGPSSGQAGFPTCGDRQGQCIPAQLIPPAHMAKLLVADCTKPTDRCVSSRILRNGPYQACTALLSGLVSYDGTCHNQDLLKIEYGGVAVAGTLSQGQCTGRDLCIPCNFGVTIPGCPGVPPVF